MDSVFFEPLVRVTITCNTKNIKHSPCLNHYLWDSSFFNILSKIAVSSEATSGLSNISVDSLFLSSS